MLGSHTFGSSVKKCLKCDEDHCGPAFIKCAGANRRSSGIVSDIKRPPYQECTSGMYYNVPKGALPTREKPSKAFVDEVLNRHEEHNDIENAGYRCCCKSKEKNQKPAEGCQWIPQGALRKNGRCPHIYHSGQTQCTFEHTINTKCIGSGPECWSSKKVKNGCTELPDPRQLPVSWLPHSCTEEDDQKAENSQNASKHI